MESINYKDFLKKATMNARENDVPIVGAFELTPLCNLDCKMCYVHLIDPIVKSRMLSGARWINLINQAISRGMIKAVLTGGEAMTHPDFRKIYMHLAEKGITLQIKSNGILLNRENIELFKKYPPFVIDVSLYGCDDDSYEAVTGHRVFEVVAKNLRAAIETGLHICISITPSKYMLPYLKRIMEFAKSLGADDVVVNSALFESKPETGRKKEEFGLSIEESMDVFQKRQDVLNKNFENLDVQEDSLFDNMSKDKSRLLPKGLYCNGGRTSFAINWDGSMGPCLTFPRELISIDLMSCDFEKGWHELNQFVKNYVVPDECQNCFCNTICHYCPALHGKYAIVHKCDESICELWKRVYLKNTNSTKTK